MDSARERAERYRRQAKACLNIGAHISLKEDRARLIEMANQWTELAKRAEEKAEFENAWKKSAPEV